MRQAGRYLPEYRALRERHSILDLCHSPELAAEVTLQPVRRFPLDAAIIFADILLPFEPLGLGLSFEKGEGPVIAKPVRSAADVAALPAVDPPDQLGYVLETVRLVHAALPVGVALIGFAGAPFTLASYAIEGGASRDFARTKQFMYKEPKAWHALLSRLADLVGSFLAAQAKAGAVAVQLFDSWVGSLAPADYREYVQPHSRRALELAATGGAPVIHFGTNTAGFLADFAAAGGDVIGVDWRIQLDTAWSVIGNQRAIQGNLDPLSLFAPRAELTRRVDDVLKAAAGRPGHIFNLGHGVLPETPIDAVQAVIDQVHNGVK
jgi:uroporphyrinogen decarboxylase